MKQRTLERRPADETIVADYPVMETAGNRLILGLGDGRMFGIELAEPVEGKLPTRAQLKVPSLDEAGVPQGATLVKFL